MRNFRHAGILIVIMAIGVILAGCQSRPEIVADSSLDAQNAGEIFVYRPASQWIGMLIDYRVTMDGKYIGSLKTGKYIQTFATPGDHVLTVRPYFLSIPDGKPSSVTVAAEPVERYYIRFSQYIDEIITTGSSAIALGGLRLQQVPLEMWGKKL